jgi:hypothetical protein
LSVDRFTADELNKSEWDPPRPWVVVAWSAALSALIASVAYLTLRPDAWDRYQQEFGCIAVTNIDASYSRSHCAGPDAAPRQQPEQLTANQLGGRRPK